MRVTHKKIVLIDTGHRRLQRWSGLSFINSNEEGLIRSTLKRVRSQAVLVVGRWSRRPRRRHGAHPGPGAGDLSQHVSKDRRDLLVEPGRARTVVKGGSACQAIVSGKFCRVELIIRARGREMPEDTLPDQLERLPLNRFLRREVIGSGKGCRAQDGFGPSLRTRRPVATGMPRIKSGGYGLRRWVSLQDQE